MTTNYHNQPVSFTVGQKVTHVNEQGSMFQATVKAVDGDILDLAFADGEEGTELASTCY